MKKIILLVALVTLTNTLCHAQFNAGLRLGLNACQIDGDRMGGYNLAGIVGGVFVSYPFNNRWEGQFEMLFSQKGSARLVNADTVQAGPWDLLRIDYIEVPVMVNYKLSPKLKFSGGLGGALMIHNHFEGKANDIQENVTWIKKGEFNGTVGMQYYFTPKFSAYARFTYSLLGIDTSKYLGAFYLYDGGLANNVLSFGVYYSFLGGNKAK
jgi:hypothetical protein